MNLDFRYAGCELIVGLTGDIDEYASRTLKGDLDRLLDAPGIRRVIIDMKNVSFVDSTGLGLILGRYKKLSAKGAELVLKNVPPQVDKVFRTSGVYRFAPKLD